MQEQHYRALESWFTARPRARSALVNLAAGAVAAVYLLYAGTLVVLFCQRDERFWLTMAVPAAVFLLGSVLRAAINRPRPYDVLNFTPPVPKSTHGRSMPSRHCFSAAAIAVAVAHIGWPLGVAGIVLAVVVGITRVLEGVHWPSDVLAGFAFGTALALVGFALAALL